MHISSKPLAGWGNYPRITAQVGYPAHLQQVRDAQASGVIARGLGRSYGDQAIDAQHLVLKTNKFNRLLAFDEQQGILTAEAGVSLEEIIRTFAPRGWFPVVNPGTKFVTLGGAIANDVHGKGHHVDGSFANCVESFTLLLADGNIVTASREENKDLFWGCFGGLGLLGIILTATIRLQKIETTYYKQRAIKVANLDELLAAFEQYDQEYHYSVSWVNPKARGAQLGQGVLTVGNQATLADLDGVYRKHPLKLHQPQRLGVPFFLPNFSLNPVTLTVLNQAIYRMQSNARPIVHYDKFLFPLDFIHHWNRGYGKRGFVQYQFVVPIEQGAQSVRAILETIAASPCLPFLNVLKKMGPGHGLLSFPQEGYTFAIDFPVTSELRNLTRRLDRMVLEAGGRIYLGKDALLAKESFQAMYPQHKAWLALKEKYDPDNQFASAIARRLGLLA